MVFQNENRYSRALSFYCVSLEIDLPNKTACIQFQFETHLKAVCLSTSDYKALSSYPYAFVSKVEEMVVELLL